jgi:uncharacterized protein YbaR (Trm112 family)/putative flippase GtrA
MSAVDPVGARTADDRRPDATARIEVPASDSRAADAEPDCADLPGAVAADPGPKLLMARRQEIAFAMVGVVNTALGIVLTVTWLAVLGHRVPAAVAPAAAYSISVVVAFVLHRTLVFRVRGHLVRDFLAFIAVNSGGLLLNMVLLQLAVSVLHLPSIPSAVVVMALVAAASFFGHRHISFRRAMPEHTTLDATLLSLLACPQDKGPLQLVRAADDSTLLYNPRLRRAYPIENGIPVLLIGDARDVTDAEHTAFTAVRGDA